MADPAAAARVRELFPLLRARRCRKYVPPDDCCLHRRVRARGDCPWRDHQGVKGLKIIGIHAKGVLLFCL